MRLRRILAGSELLALSSLLGSFVSIIISAWFINYYVDALSKFEERAAPAISLQDTQTPKNSKSESNDHIERKGNNERRNQDKNGKSRPLGNAEFLFRLFYPLLFVVVIFLYVRWMVQVLDIHKDHYFEADNTPFLSSAAWSFLQAFIQLIIGILTVIFILFCVSYILLAPLWVPLQGAIILLFWPVLVVPLYFRALR